MDFDNIEIEDLIIDDFNLATHIIEQIEEHEPKG